MTDKGLVTRNEKSRSHVYTAKRSQDHTQKQLVRDLLDRAFAGSAQKLVMQALAAQKASPQELAEIRKLLDQTEAETQAPTQANSQAQTDTESKGGLQ
jgi:predicted transcriptional regulator